MNFHYHNNIVTQDKNFILHITLTLTNIVMMSTDSEPRQTDMKKTSTLIIRKQAKKQSGSKYDLIYLINIT